MSRRLLDYHPLTLWNTSSEDHFFREEGGGIYSYMFVEDVTNHIMPYSTHSSQSGKSYDVVLNDPSAEIEIKALFHFPYENDYYYQPLSDAIFDFIRKTAGFLLGSGGRAYFEIVNATFAEDKISKPVLVLKPIFGKVIRFGGNYYQKIPKEYQEGKKKYISIPHSKVWRLEMPRELGSRKGVATLSHNLINLGKASFIDSQILLNQIKLYDFDVRKFHATIDSLVLKASEQWGWDMRMGLNNQYSLEYFLYYRMLRFSHSMAVCRSDMLSKMNALLKRLNYNLILSFTGIPTPEDYLAAIEKMKQRQLSFKEANNLIYFSL
jgi:hypothetical protein